MELGIAESSLLGSALLVYMAPLFGLFVMASIFQVLFASDIASLCGALLGGVGGFGGAWAVAEAGCSPVVAAGDFKRWFTAGSAARRYAFLWNGAVISLSLIFIYAS